MLIPPDYEPQRQHAIDELAAKNRLTNPKIANFWHAFLNEVTRIPRDSGAEETGDAVADRLVSGDSRRADGN